MAKTSLVGRANAGAAPKAEKAETLPAVPEANNLPMMPNVETNVTPSGNATPYVAFASTRSKSYPAQVAAIPGLNEGDAVLMRPDGAKPLGLSPLRFFFVAGFQYFAARASDGKLTAASLVKAEGLHKEVETLLIVITPDGDYVPARGTFKRGNTPAAEVAAVALAKCQTAEWANEGPDFAETLKVPTPFARFTVTATTGRKVSKKKGSAGNLYNVAEGRVVPVTPAEVSGLAASFNDEEWNAAYKACVAAFNASVAAVKAAAEKAPAA